MRNKDCSYIMLDSDISWGLDPDLFFPSSIGSGSGLLWHFMSVMSYLIIKEYVKMGLTKKSIIL